VVEFGERQGGDVERQQGDAHQALIAAREFAHGPVVSPGGGVAVLDRPLFGKGRTRRKGGEDQLAVEAQKVQGGAPLCGVEGAKGAVALGSADEAIAKGGQLGDPLGGVASPRLRFLEQIGERTHARNLDLRHPLAQPGIGMVLEEVRQLHDVAVGIVEGAALGVGHLAWGSVREVDDCRPRREGVKQAGDLP